VVWIEEIRNTFLAAILKRRSVGKHKHTLEDNIKMVV
jgi:hypothetical protein